MQNKQNIGKKVEKNLKREPFCIRGPSDYLLWVGSCSLITNPC